MLVRSGPLSDAAIQRLVAERFVPVAIDLAMVRPDWRFTPEGSVSCTTACYVPEEGAVFEPILKQDPMSQGIWLVTAEGKVLRSSYHVTPAPMLAVMRAAVREWEEIGGAPPLALPPRLTGPRADPAEPPAAVVLRFYGRLDDGSGAAPYRDTLRFTRREWEALWPEAPTVGQTLELPAAALEAIMRRLYAGEMRLAVRPEEIRHAEARVTVRSIENGIAVADVQGRLAMSGSFPFIARHRQYDAALRGEIHLRADSREPTRVEIVSDGEWRAEYPEGLPQTAVDLYPTATLGGRLVLGPPTRLVFLIELDQPPVSGAALVER